MIFKICILFFVYKMVYVGSYLSVSDRGVTLHPFILEFNISELCLGIHNLNNTWSLNLKNIQVKL